MSQPHPTPQKQRPLQANPNVTAQKTTYLILSHKMLRLRLRIEFILHASSSHISTRFLTNSHESDTSCFHPKPSPKASPNVSAIAPYCERLTTVAVARTLGQRVANRALPPDPLRVKREPFAMHSGKRNTSPPRQTFERASVCCVEIRLRRTDGVPPFPH